MAYAFLRPASILTGTLIFSLLPLASSAAPEGQPFRQEFRVSSSGVPVSINAERRLRQLDDNTWQMEVEAKNLIGRIREVTRFAWQDCTPLTTHYSYLRQGLGQKREASMVLDRDRGIADVNRNGSKRQYPIDHDTTDKLSQTLALQCMLQRGDTELVLDVADEKGREQQRYLSQGEEWLQTPAGALRAVRLVRDREAEEERQTSLWFAVDHNFALVKLVQEEQNQRHEMVIRSL
jgi:hypothetical protein